MASVNLMILIGHIGQEPISKFLPSGDPVCNFTLATTETWKTKDGTKQEEVTWHNIVAFNKLAQICQDHLHKGSLIYVEGRIQNKKYTDKNGAEKHFVSVKMDTMKMLGPRPEGGRNEPSSAPRDAAPGTARPDRPPVMDGGSGFDDMANDLPF